MQKTLTFNGVKFEAGSVSSISKLTKAISFAPNRLVQAVNFAVEASLYHTENNQLGPLKELLAALAFSDHAALKKQGAKLQAYIKSEVNTLEVIVSKKQEKVVVKYIAEEGKRDLPANLPAFASWEIPKGEEKTAPAVTEKAVTALTSKWAKREKALQDQGKAEDLAAERLQLKTALMQALDQLAPELELFKAEKEGFKDSALYTYLPEASKPGLASWADGAKVPTTQLDGSQVA